MFYLHVYVCMRRYVCMCACNQVLHAADVGDQVVPVLDLFADRTEEIPSKRQRQRSAPQPQSLAMSTDAAGFWDVFDGASIFG